MDIEQFRKAGYQAIDNICDHFYNLQNLPVRPDVEPGFLAKSLPDAPPEKGEDFQLIADDYHKVILPGMTYWPHPSFFGYFPTACTFEAILGDLYASSVPNPGFNWAASPAATELEMVVMDWLAKLFHLSPDFLNSSGIGGGALQTTASDSALIAVVAARSKYQKNHPDIPIEKMIVYVTSQTHSLGAKAALVLGVQVRTLEATTEDDFGLRGATLAAALKEDIDMGLHPFVLVGTVGTTSSGAVDDITEIVQTLKSVDRDVWLHIDAAWAGIALSCPEYHDWAHLKAINEYAHSFCTNLHKWGLTNFDASTLWVRNRRWLNDALDVTPEFLRTAQGDAGTAIDYRNWHLALGRKFRSLKVWFVLRAYGTEGFQKMVRRHVNLNEKFIDLVKSSNLLTLVATPSLSLSVFRLDPVDTTSGERRSRSATADALNTLNVQLHKRLSSRSDVWLTQTSLNGTFCVRLAIGSTNTEEKHIDHVFKLICEESEATLKAEKWLKD